MQILFKNLSIMSKKRVICGLAATVISVALCVMVTYYWNQLGCDGWSLAASIAFNLTFPTCLWACVDDVLKRKENQ